MTANDPSITLAQLAMCPDGHLHVTEGVEVAACAKGPVYVNASTDAKWVGARSRRNAVHFCGSRTTTIWL